MIFLTKNLSLLLKQEKSKFFTYFSVYIEKLVIVKV